MVSTLLASSSGFSDVTRKITLEFPNLFEGTRITYSRGFNIFGLSIYWYGILIAVGLVLAYFYAMHRMEKDFGIVKDRAFDVIFAATIGGFLCARIYYCVFTTLNPDSGMKYNFITTFTTIHDGGIAIYGGIIGAVLVGLLFCKIRKVHFRAMADVAALGFLIGQGIGRWGNFINQEAYGAACDKDFLFAMTGTRIASEMGEGVVVHPCFLYESLWCLLGFVLLHFYSKKLRTYDGEIALLYVAWYGLERFFVEGLRTDSLMAGKFRISQLVAGISFVIAIVLFAVFKIMAKKRGYVLYVNSDSSKELIAHDKQLEEERLEKKKARKKALYNSTPEVTTEDTETADNEENTEDNTEENAEDNTKVNTEDDTDVNTKGDTDVNTKDDTDVNTKDNTEVNAENDTKVNTEDNTEDNKDGTDY
ncbi:MAG: prolipoprotein diacylglyceryl transferase [Oscillospiraceae bacterium]